MPEANNIDSLLASSSSDKSIPDDSFIISKEPVPESVPDSPDEMIEENNQTESDQEETISEESNSTENQTKDSTIDEYGNPIGKQKLYTEEEVQKKIKERLSRGRYAKEQPSQQQVQQAAQDFQSDPNSEESWEIQLESFVEKTLEKRQAKLEEQQWREKETIKHMEFEEKFTTGMSRYSDFKETISKMPITDSMIMATRALDNPAAFLYGASKLHSKELHRISQIDDKSSQAFEIGRLHERMIKERKSISSAPKPLEVPKGDVGQKYNAIPSIDQRIQEHAKRKSTR